LSLTFEQEFTVIDPPDIEEPGITTGAGLFAGIVLLIIAGVAGWIYLKRKKR
jgi:LPXTG-motif cell wall-anchored protein